MSLRIRAQRAGGFERMVRALENDTAIVAALNGAARNVRDRALAKLAKGGRSGKLYAQSGRKSAQRSSAPGEAPAVQTGNLLRGVRARMAPKSKKYRRTAIVAAASPHAHLLEFGTVTMKPRPFLGPALNEAREESFGKISSAMRRQIRSAVQESNNAGVRQ